MRRFRVHIFAVVRVPVEVEAETPLEAARQVDDTFPYYEVLNRSCEGFPPEVGDIEFAEQVLDFIVDKFDEKGELKDSGHFKYKDIY